MTVAKRPGAAARLLAVGRGLVLLPLMLAGLVMSVIAVAGPLLSGSGFLVLAMSIERGMQGGVLLPLMVTITGLAVCRLVMVPAMLAVRRLAVLTRTLARRWCGVPVEIPYRPPRAGEAARSFQQRAEWLLTDPATWRDLLWMLVNATAGLVTAVLPAVLVAAGVIGFIVPVFSHAVPPPAFPGNSVGALLAIGGGLTGVGLWWAPCLLRGYGVLASTLLAPTGEAELRMRVTHLDQTRSETIDTGAAELRRIERDLHDGAQARLVAMGITLDAASRIVDHDPAAAKALLLEARDSSARALAELRDLVRGIHPPVLADRGLADAVRALALDCPLPVSVVCDLVGRPAAAVESAAYFAVSELLANVSKHAGAGRAEVDMRHEAGTLRIIVSDDGRGGADDRTGTGLRGIERRLAAFDGVLAITSPDGGPTVMTMEIPCAL